MSATNTSVWIKTHQTFGGTKRRENPINFFGGGLARKELFNQMPAFYIVVYPVEKGDSKRKAKNLEEVWLFVWS